MNILVVIRITAKTSTCHNNTKWLYSIEYESKTTEVNENENMDFSDNEDDINGSQLIENLAEVLAGNLNNFLSICYRKSRNRSAGAPVGHDCYT